MSHQGPRGGEIDAGLEDEGHSAKKLDPPLVGPNHEAVSVPTSERSQRPGGAVSSPSTDGFALSQLDSHRPIEKPRQLGGPGAKFEIV